MIELNSIIHADCMDIMKDIPDKYFELAVVDPPYANNLSGGHSKKNGWNENIAWTKAQDGWNSIKPDKEYFYELKRASKNLIIWGGNYFSSMLEDSEGWIFWDKGQRNFSLADGELAYSSFDRALRVFTFTRAKNNKLERFHPTQKPVALYRWLLQNYAKPGDKIIDTHSGSGSCAIACHLEKFDFLAIEKDKDYYEASVKRLDEVRSQGVLF